jgi:hypothetical protein
MLLFLILKIACYLAIALLHLLGHLVEEPWRERLIGLLYLLVVLALVGKPVLSALSGASFEAASEGPQIVDVAAAPDGAAR